MKPEDRIYEEAIKVFIMGFELNATLVVVDIDNFGFVEKIFPSLSSDYAGMH